MDQIAPVKKAYVWSDGCSYQYKGRGTFADLTLMDQPKSGTFLLHFCISFILQRFLTYLIFHLLTLS